MRHDRLLATLLKAELHVHMEGCLHPKLIERISARNGQQCDTSLTRQVYNDIDSFMQAYFKGLEVLHTEKDFFDLVWDYAQKAAEQNIVHVEMFFDPQAHTERGVALDTVMRGFINAAARAWEKHNMTMVLIMCFLRERSAESAMETLVSALPYKAWIVGIGLDGDANGHPPLKFAEVFRRAKVEGFRTTVHCDIVPNESVEHIRQGLVDMDVDRLDHASCLLDDEDVAAVAIRKRIVVTCCPQTDLLFYGDRGADKIRRMLRVGVKCTINSDDPGYFDCDLNNSLSIMPDEGLGMSELVAMLRFSIEGSWMEEGRKESLLDSFDSQLAEHSV